MNPFFVCVLFVESLIAVHVINNSSLLVNYSIFTYVQLSWCFLGDPMLLHYIIKSKPLDMASLDTLEVQQLRAICRDCKIDNVASLSKVSFF